MVRKAVRSGVLLLTVVLLCGLAEGLYGGMGVSQTTDVGGHCGRTGHHCGGGGGRQLPHRNGTGGAGTDGDLFKDTPAHDYGGGRRRRLSQWGSGPPTGHHALSDILITLINRLLLPLVYTYIAACVAYAAVGNEGLKRIAGTLKWVVTSILTVVLLVLWVI